MPATFRQTVVFPHVTPQELFDIYLSSERHAAAIGAEARIDPVVGGRFALFGPGGVTGRTLDLVPSRRIVQAWRGAAWKKSEPDSILVLNFSRAARGAQLSLLHIDVPEAARARVNPTGWTNMYWRPWRAYLASQHRRATARKRS